MQSATARQYEFEDAEEGKSTAEGIEQSSHNMSKKGHTILFVDRSESSHITSVTPNFERTYLKPKHQAMMPTLFKDVGRYWYFYFLCLLLCALSLFKVYQVQQTRLLTAEFNELVTGNDDLSNEWLGLLAKKQELEKQSAIRETAIQRLGMMQPKTEAEIVIRLDR